LKLIKKNIDDLRYKTII